MDYIERLKALEAAATKGPWRSAKFVQQTEEKYGHWVEIDGPQGEAALIFVGWDDYDERVKEAGAQAERTAAFISESRTAIPWLVGMIEEARGLMGHDLDIAQRAQLVWAWDAKLRQGPPERGK